MKKILLIFCSFLIIGTVGASSVENNNTALKHLQDYFYKCYTANSCIDLKNNLKNPYFKEQLYKAIENLKNNEHQTNNSSNNQPSLLEDGNKQCKQLYGDNAIWNGKYLNDGSYSCECRSLYELNSDKTQCVKKMTNTERDRLCKSTYGEYSFGTGKYNIEGDYECVCQKGYDWNSDFSKCVSISYDSSAGNRACQIEFGGNAYWGGKYASDLSYQCECKTGYKWNNEGNYCILR